jgi:hypothetical protein
MYDMRGNFQLLVVVLYSITTNEGRGDPNKAKKETKTKKHTFCLKIIKKCSC